MLLSHRRIFGVIELYGTIVIMDTQKNETECKMNTFGESQWLLLFIKPCRDITATSQQPSSSLKVTLDYIDKEMDERLVVQFDIDKHLENFFNILAHLKNEIC